MSDIKKVVERIAILDGIPDLGRYPLEYLMENMRLQKRPNELWLEFGVASGRTINYFSQFAGNDPVYGFDSFEGLPERWREGFEKGSFDMQGHLPAVRGNVVLVKGWFENSLPGFVEREIIETGRKVSFLHIDSDLYSSAIYILETLREHLTPDCVILFDELVNYDGFEGETGELRAWVEFVKKYGVKYRWIGMNGHPIGMRGYVHENVALQLVG